MLSKYGFFLRGKDAPNLSDLKASGERGQFNGGGKRLYANSIWKVHGRIGEAVWIQVGIDEVQSRKEQLTCCLVGRWGECSDLGLEVCLLNRWVTLNWPLSGGVKISLL